jgi:hypothetical protein
MFVENCRIIENEILRFPKVTKKPSRKAKDTVKTLEDSTGESSNFAQGFKSSDGDEDMTFHPVICEICSTKVAVIEQDEVYHFFNIIPEDVNTLQDPN